MGRRERGREREDREREDSGGREREDREREDSGGREERSRHCLSRFIWNTASISNMTIQHQGKKEEGVI